MKGSKLLTGALTLGLIFSGTVIAMEAPHRKITIDGVRPAGFDHDTHLVFALECGVCHHNSKNEPFSNGEVRAQAEGKTLHCGFCHNPDFENQGLRSLKVVMHRQCKGCHQVGVNGVKGPTRCVGCHKERKPTAERNRSIRQQQE